MAGKKLWIIFAANVQGKLFLDDGAVSAIASGASLLLPGITSVQGEFHKNDVVEIWDGSENCLGRGMTNYSSQEIDRFIRMYKQDKKLFRSQNIEEIVHTEKMALFC
jgi:glutamate 5-kinase